MTGALCCPGGCQSCRLKDVNLTTISQSHVCIEVNSMHATDCFQIQMCQIGHRIIRIFCISDCSSLYHLPLFLFPSGSASVVAFPLEVKEFSTCPALRVKNFASSWEMIGACWQILTPSLLRWLEEYITLHNFNVHGANRTRGTGLSPPAASPLQP